MGFRTEMSREENEEKIGNDHVLRNDYRIKTTQPISIILVSFFSEDNVLSDEIKICYIFYINGTKIERSAFFGTPDICECLVAKTVQVTHDLEWRKGTFIH